MREPDKYEKFAADLETVGIAAAKKTAVIASNIFDRLAKWLDSRANPKQD